MARASRNARPLAAVAVAALLAGCATDDGGYKTADLNNQVPVENAFMVPPPGGPAVIAVLENRYTNGLAQDIILENSTGAAGQNVIYVQAYGPMGRDRGRGELDADTVDLADIRSELRERFPGVHMEVSGLYAQNRYGPLSYATGQTRSGASCIYTWQRIAAEPGLFRAQTGAITWRMRLCDARASARDLLLIAYATTITGYFLSDRWNPYGDPPALDERIGEPGATILPEQTVDPTVIPLASYGEGAAQQTIRAPRRNVARQPSRQLVRTEPVRPAVLNDPVPGAAVVPRPENTDLSEPLVEDSNLPESRPAPPSRLNLPAPPGQQSLVPLPPPGPVRPAATTVPSVSPPPTGARVILPQAVDTGAPTVRVVGAN